VWHQSSAAVIGRAADRTAGDGWKDGAQIYDVFTGHKMKKRTEYLQINGMARKLKQGSQEENVVVRAQEVFSKSEASVMIAPWDQ
jgi:hypothetical protein